MCSSDLFPSHDRVSIAVNGTTWQVSITINSVFTSGLNNIQSRGWYEFHFIDADNNDIPFFEGQVNFEPGGLR